jgi:hypothetical protein
VGVGNIENLNLTLPRWELIGRPVSLQPRPAPLAGREDLLASIHDRLTGGDAPWPRIVVLHGMGGAGKTSVAVEYAHRHQAEVSVAWQFAAEDRATLEAGFAQLAALLGTAGGPMDPRAPVACVHAALADSPLPWLLLFDNVPGPAAVREFLPAAGHGQVLISSQHGLWPAGQSIEVLVLDADVAAGFLVNRTSEPDLRAAAELAAELGGLPLALEQAAAYIEATVSSLAEYLGLFRQRRAELLQRGEVAGHPASVAATLAMAFSRLRDDAPSAAGLLRLIACLAPEPVPLRLLLRPNRTVAKRLRRPAAQQLKLLLDDPIEAADAVSALRRYSLVTSAGDGLILMHRLVQAMTLNQMPGDEAAVWKQAATALVGSAIPAIVSRPENWPACAMLLPHAQATLADSSRGMARIASYLGQSGNYPAARDLQRKVAAARGPILGTDHRVTLAERHRAARWTGEAGDPATARDVYADLLSRHEQVLGAEHRTTLSTRSYLAFWTGEAGDPTRARDMFAELLPVEERVLGAEHPFSLGTRGNIARWTGEAGKPAAAGEMFAKLLPMVERVLGAEHRSTLTARDGLARWTGEAGDPAAARDMFAELLPDLERILGPEHPYALGARGSLALWTGQAGDPAAARDMFAELLPDLERILGPDHRYTLRSRVGLARWTGR